MRTTEWSLYGLAGTEPSSFWFAAYQTSMLRRTPTSSCETSSVIPVTAWSPTYGQRSRLAPSSRISGPPISQPRGSRSTGGETMSAAVSTEPRQIMLTRLSFESKAPSAPRAGARPPASSASSSATTSAESSGRERAVAAVRARIRGSVEGLGRVLPVLLLPPLLLVGLGVLELLLDARVLGGRLAG